MPVNHTQLWLVDDVGAPIMHVSKQEAFEIVVVTPRRSSEVPDHIWVTVTVGDQSKPLRVPWSGQDDSVVQYRLPGQRLDDDEAFMDSSEHDFSVQNGETLSVATDGGQPFLGFAYEVPAARDTSVAVAHLTQAFENWLTFRNALQSLPDQNEATQNAITMSTGYLQMLSLGLEQIRRFLAGDEWDQQGLARATALYLVNLIPADPALALANDSQAYIGGLWNSERFRSDMRHEVKAYVTKVDDQFSHTFAIATIASYRGFAQYSGGDVWFTGLTGVYEKYAARRAGDDDWYNRTGIDEMGQKKTLGALGVELIIEKVVGGAFSTAIRRGTGEVVLDIQFNKGRGRVDGRSTTASAHSAGPPATRSSAATPGRIVDPSTHGIRDSAIPIFQSIARRHDVIISLRPGNQDSMVWQALGHSVKSTELKTKTVKDVDVVIGGPRRSGVENGPESPVGLVGVFDPRLPSRPPGLSDAQWNMVTHGGRRPAEMTDDVEWTEFKTEWATQVKTLLDGWRPEGVPLGIGDQLVGRFIQRRIEFADNMPSLRKLEEQGLIRIDDGLVIDTGLYRNTNKPITGDYDVFDIHGVDGKPVTYEKYKDVITELGLDPDALVVHGAHTRWKDDAPFLPGSKEEGIYNAIMDGHQKEVVLLIGGFEDGLIRTSFTIEQGGQFPLITMRDGSVMWAGGIIQRATPLELAAHAGPMSLDQLSRAETIVNMVPLSFLQNRDQGPAAPPDQSPDLTPEEQARQEAAMAANKKYVDDMIATSENPDLAPKFIGDSSLWAEPGDGPSDGPSDKAPSDEEKLAKALRRDTPAPIEEEPWLQPGGSDEYCHPDDELIQRFVPFVPYGGDGLAGSVGRAAASLEILNRDQKRLEFLEREYGPHPAVRAALETIQILQARQGKMLALTRNTLELSISHSRDQVREVLAPLGEQLADALLAPDEPGFEHMSEPMITTAPIHPYKAAPSNPPWLLIAVGTVVLALIVGITFALTRGGDPTEDVVAQDVSDVLPVDDVVENEPTNENEVDTAEDGVDPDGSNDAAPIADEWTPGPELEAAMHSVMVEIPALAGHIDTGPPKLWSVEGTEVGIGEDTGVPGASIVSFGSGVMRATDADVAVQHNESTHPCGAATDVFHVTCPLAAGPMPSGEHIVVVVELDQLGQLDGSTFTYGLAFDDDQDSSDNYQSGGVFNWDFFIDTELWYQLEIGPNGDRRVWAQIAQPGAIRPRHSSAAVIEHGRFLIWIIPRGEVPGDQVGFRATAFRNDGPTGQQPVPESSGGDVSGENPTSPLTPIDLENVVALNSSLSNVADFGPAPVPRVDPGPDPELALWAAFAREFSERVTESLLDEDALFSLLHPGAVEAFGGEDACRNLIRTTVGLAEDYRIAGPPQPTEIDGLTAYSVPVEYTFSTGTVPSQDLLASTGDGQVAWVFPCTG